MVKETGKVYVVANTFQDDFHIFAATANKELAEAVYNKVYDRSYRGMKYASGLELLEYTDEEALTLLNM